MTLVLIFKVLLATIFMNSILLSDPCQESHRTVKYVDRCPKTAIEWKERSQMKKCDQIKQGCTDKKDFQYHCLINEYSNKTVEVCAPVSEILGYRCAEYNIIGRRIQDNADLNCTSCPFQYNSNLAYKYQECYAVVRQKEVQKQGKRPNDTCSEFVWIILFTISLIVNIVLAIVICRLHLNKKSGDGRNREERVCLLPLQSPDNSPQTLQTECVDSPREPRHGDANHTKNIFVAAIQFGDRICGFTFSRGDDPGKVELNHHGIFPKPYTTIRLLRHDNKVHSWGFDALKNYATCKRKEAKRYTYFDELHFELEDGKFYVRDSKGIKHKAETIYKEYLECAVEYAKIEINKLYKSDTPKNDEIHFIFTVPNRWGAECHSAMKGIINKIFPSEAAQKEINILKAYSAVSSFVHEVNEEVMCHNFKADNLKFTTGFEYAVLNIGSYACEISFLRVQTEGSDYVYQKNRLLEEKAPEKCFLQFLIDIFTKTPIERLEKEHPEDYYAMMLSFEMWQLCCENDRADVNIKLASSFLKLVKQETRCEAESLLHRSRNSDKIELHKESLIINKDLMMEECFSKVAEFAYDLAKDEIAPDSVDVNKPYTNVSFICLTGVYSKVKRVQDYIKEKFPKKTVAIPSKPYLVVAKGAAFYCCKKLTSANHNV